MREQRKFSLLKKITASLLAIILVFSGLVIMSQSTHAEETTGEVIETDGEIIYSSNYYSIQEYYPTKKAPVKENHVFGGWYQKEEETFKALSAAEAVAIVDGTSTVTAYAKFVPAYVLGVKAQNAEGTTEDMTGNTSVRMITSVDSKKYQKVGFEIYLGNGTTLLTQDDGSALETSRVYKGIKIGTDKTKTATQIFGTASKHVAVWELTDIWPENHTKIIYVRPYWITMDGTTVKGLAKYVHIEDGYNGYISIPISLRTAELVAAGQLELSYDSEKIEIAKDAAGNMLVENGKMFDKMAFNGNIAGSIKFVGNTSDATDVAADDIYVNVRFKKASESTYKGAGKGEFLSFKVSGEKFCNADELIQKTVDAWDIKY